MATQSLVAELQSLVELHGSGALTESEFSLAKKQLLGQSAAAAALTPPQQQQQQQQQQLHLLRAPAHHRCG